jgi:hypothetical protein
MAEGIRWLISLAVSVVAVIVGWLAWQYPKFPQTVSPGSSRAPAAISTALPRTMTAAPVRTMTASPLPTVRNLKVSQFQVGDCLTGTNLPLGGGGPWPALALAVPCSQAHTAEVFYINRNFWNGGSYANLVNASDGTCGNAFKSYVGIADSNSIYSWEGLNPDRTLICIAWLGGVAGQGPASIFRSIKGVSI